MFTSIFGFGYKHLLGAAQTVRWPERVWIALAVERDTIAVGFKTKLVRLKRNVPWYQQRWINSRCSSHHHPVRCAMLSVSTLSNISICSPPKSGRGSAQVKHMTPPTLPYAVNVSFVADQGWSARSQEVCEFPAIGISTICFYVRERSPSLSNNPQQRLLSQSNAVDNTSFFPPSCHLQQ